ncbi:molybdenum cofactor biosynthesis protein MoaE [Echinicola strongylocentroti]|uniref:Molybdopterin synthase catalytic subunit n=1 Tax=Echinicola strongylocentroti TaxID=1795355 RepID=A0A2Z4IG56_9BACT|nr:molybdenum cofactor biosynthesis protein MoaE [Echinicola strongylocentroti]AWW29670.1 molybdenum cofactor biosynthesis protein MoaE [Echinicola strongylocentroti]
MEKVNKIKDIFVNGAISPDKIAKSIANHSGKTAIGAHSIFLGQIRADEKDGKSVVSMEYTAYRDMALEKAREIREEAFSKYDLTCLHIYHSLGEVKVGEICLFVFTSSPHRKAAITACNELVERIKSDLPIWGKEVLDDDSEQWKVNR